MRRRTIGGTAAALAACAAVAIPAGAQGGAHSAGTHTVVLHSLKFQPVTLRIHRGDTVKWLWRDGSIKHNVTGSRFKSKTMSKGSFSVRFTKAGTFAYRCTIHAALGMQGRIVVR